MAKDLNFDQAIDVLQRMQQAAPPLAAEKISGVISLLERLREEDDGRGTGVRTRDRTGLLNQAYANLFAPAPEDQASTTEDDPDDNAYDFSQVPLPAPRPAVRLSASLFDDLMDENYQETRYDEDTDDDLIGEEPRSAADALGDAFLDMGMSELEVNQTSEEMIEETFDPPSDARSWANTPGFFEDLPDAAEPELPNPDTSDLFNLFDGFIPGEEQLPRTTFLIEQLPDFPSETGVAEADLDYPNVDSYLNRPITDPKITKRLSPTRLEEYEQRQRELAAAQPTDETSFAQMSTLEVPLARPEPADEPATLDEWLSLFGGTVVENAESLQDDTPNLEDVLSQSAAPHRPVDVEPVQAEQPTVDQLLNSVSEVMKPSLALLRAQTELLRDRPDVAASSSQVEMLRLMQDNAETALTMLDSLEQIIQLREGRYELHRTAFEPARLQREVGERLIDRARAAQHRIIFQLDETAPQVYADYRRAVSILYDLLDNALRYSPQGSVSRVMVDNLGTHVLFTVEDHGIGLSGDDLEEIGKPFWRGTHHALVRQHRGTGLRLYLAQRVLALMGGELIFTGEEEGGSTFSFTLPVKSNGDH